MGYDVSFYLRAARNYHSPLPSSLPSNQSKTCIVGDVSIVQASIRMDVNTLTVNEDIKHSDCDFSSAVSPDVSHSIQQLVAKSCGPVSDISLDYCFCL